MVKTRSTKNEENAGEAGATSEEQGSSSEVTTRTESTERTTSTEETGTTQTSGSTTVTSDTGHRPIQKPPPPAVRSLKPARSNRSKASSKRLLAELEAKERLAELELQQIRAQAELEKIRQERAAASEPSDSEQEDVDEMASQRVEEWLDKRQQQEAVAEQQIQNEEATREPAARAQKKHERHSRPAPLDVSSLAAALTEAIQVSKSTRKYITELPPFSGLSSEWLQFKATYNETASSFSPNENVARIRKSLKGAAQEAVSALLISQPHPDDVITALERRFGRPDALLLAELEKTKTLPRLTDNARDLCVFASRIANTVATIKLLKRAHYLHNPEVARLIVDKLTPILRSKWYDYAEKHENAPELEKIAKFLNKEADKCAAYAPPEQAHMQQEKRPTPKRRPERTYAISTEERKIKKTVDATCPLCKNENHQLPKCPRFLKADTNERWETAKKNHICYRCLVDRHHRFDCKAKPCGRDGCPMRHHNLLHHDRATTAAAAPQPPQLSQQKEEVAATAVTQTTAAVTGGRRAYLKIVPVVVRGPSACIDTYAMLDGGSTVTIIDAALAEELGLDGPAEPMWVQGVSGTEVSNENSKRVGFNIRGKHERDELRVENARTIARLDFTTQTIGEHELRGCHHLEEIKNELTYHKATPKILIGQDNWELLVSLDMKRGRRDQLVASKTPLGWVIHGCRTSHAAVVAFCCAHVTGTKQDERLEEMMKNYFALESLSIEPRKQKSDPELRALQILETRSRRLPDGRFETGLLWRDENTDVPSNRHDALKRLLSLEKKLDRDENLKKQYEERIENLLSSGYAERAIAPPAGRTWYLPHFAVCNPEKPKIRVVHDAAAKTRGRSLNDMLLPGPDLLQSLPGVIMRFRQHAVAVSADIKEMFMQIKIRQEDRDALRFLWRGSARNVEPTEYRMTSVVFGASSSPCTALYIKNRNAQEQSNEYPQAADAIERNHYMDDYLQSFNTLQEAKKITREVDYVHKKAGFQLRGWAATNRAALHDIADQHKQDPAPTIEIGGNETEKTLGLLWDTRHDCIGFRLNTRRAPPEVLEHRRAPTKREALSIIMSLFDPLGLVSPSTTPAKRIMQDTWRYNTSWDEPIPEELHGRWYEWLRQLHSLGDLKIPRCYDTAPAARYELHTFVDASEEAYASAVYWRMTRADGSINVALAAGKSRVTPNKPISVPRLELQAAVLGVRLAKAVADEHDYEATRKVYWSDSRTALAWIRAEPRTYKTFVAHRLAEIEDYTKKNEWRWLPSGENVADDATRATPADFGEKHRWFVGPPFLYKTEATWPVEQKIDVPLTGEEKEKTQENCLALEIQQEKHAHLPEIERFSKWTRLLRATARVLQFVDLCKKTLKRSPAAQVVAAARRKRTRANTTRDEAWGAPGRGTKPAIRTVPAATEENSLITLEASYLHRAEQLWERASQEDRYKEERERIRKNRAPNKEDRLAKLSVFLDENDVIRLKGRIAAAGGIQEDTVRPVVLPGKHPYTRLYIAYVHERLHHGSAETVVNELRQRVHITKIRPAVKEVIARCAKCRLRKAKPAAPSTGDLPAARLAHHVRPYTYTGLDYFGPIEVTVGRHREKRYVALFTCMTSRAVHLEIVASLSTDAAINALRRFIARRGCPTELWTDNATAFRAADRELAEAMKTAATARRISWRFLPPAAPFMAGAWERMVRTVKDALRITLQEKSPSDETLLTLLAEAEATVNSRPLTHVAVGHDDPPALTPNMILLGPDCYNPAPGTFTEEDVNARQHWRRAQQLADTFWKRWVREYLPLLQHRREPLSSGVSPAVGDVVIICDSNLPRNTWPRGKVTQTYPGRDGEVRVVDVTTSRGHVLRRPTKKIVVLPVDSRGDGGRMFTTEA